MPTMSAEISPYGTVYVWGTDGQMCSYWFTRLEYDRYSRRMMVYKNDRCIGTIPIKWLTNN